MPFSRRGAPVSLDAEARLDALALHRPAGWVPPREPAPPVLQPPEALPAAGPTLEDARAGRRPSSSVPEVTPADLGAPVPDLGGVTGLLRAAVADRLPASLRGARLELSWAAAGALLLVCLLCVGVAGVGFLRARQASAGAADLPPPPETPAPATGGALVAGSAAAGGVVVDVGGRVRRPGLVTLPPGARVADALRAAGGALRPADVALLNLARRLVDGEQLLVGVRPPGGAAAGASGPPAGAGTAESPLDLNAATLADLDRLPGVGAVLAQRIVDWRTAHSGFTSIDQLRQVGGIGARKFEQLRPLVRV